MTDRYPWIMPTPQALPEVAEAPTTDSCARCGYGPLYAYGDRRRKKCPACFRRLDTPGAPAAPANEPEPATLSEV